MLPVGSASGCFPGRSASPENADWRARPSDPGKILPHAGCPTAGPHLLVYRGFLSSPGVPLAATQRQTTRDTVPRPGLYLSVRRGGLGTKVSVKGIHCAPLPGQRDELSWHDSYELSHRDSGYRKVRPLRRVGSTLTATFSVLATDHRGKGLLDLFCGGSRGNAVAYFLVT